MEPSGSACFSGPPWANWRLSEAFYAARNNQSSRQRYTVVIDEFTRAIVNGPDDGLIWLRLARNELIAADDHAMASA